MMRVTRLKYFILILSAASLFMHSCKDEDPCDGIDCLNGGACVEGTCECPEGFTGVRCETEDRCISQNIDCLNGGTCKNGECDCPDGFTGARCEIEDRCITQNIECQNGGVCINGGCDCPDGYIGSRCERVDLTKIQALLDRGVSPKTLYDAGVPVEELYGKLYQDGLIFYFNTSNGTGMVCAKENQAQRAEWGCRVLDIPNLNNVSQSPTGTETIVGTRVGDGPANTDAILAGCVISGIAAELCRDLGPEWFLPSRGELDLMYANLRNSGLGNFGGNYYWSSTEGVEIDNSRRAWARHFGNGDIFPTAKFQTLYVRAAKAFR